MRKLGLLLLLIFTGSFVSAQTQSDIHNEIVLGVLRQSSARNFVTGDRTGVRPGFGLGVKTESYDCHGLTLKLGLMYEQREATDIFGGIEHNFKMKHIDLLTHVSYKATDFLSIFAGPQFTVLLSSECKASSGPCLVTEYAQKYFIPVSAGLDFTFMTNYGVEAYYEWISQEFWEKTFEKGQTYGLNLKYKF